jgi:hypothetical protein
MPTRSPPWPAPPPAHGIGRREHFEVVAAGASAVHEWRRRNPTVPLDLRFADLRGMRLREAPLAPADLTRADLRKADLGLASLGRSLKGARLNGAFLDGASLDEADLRDADLRDAHLEGAHMSRASLRSTDLRGADLRSAHLAGALFETTRLAGARLEGADLTSARFRSTDVGDADFRRARFGLGEISNVDLSAAASLEYAVHAGPTAIERPTLRMSRGRIHERFLKGCGLDDWEAHAARLHDPDLTTEEIQEIHNLAGAARLSKPIQTRPLFVSYSHGDSGAVDRIVDALQSSGVRVWRDVVDGVAGPLHEQIHVAMQDRIVLVVLSSAALGSEWVRHEMRHALELEAAQRRRVLCPIAIDNAWSGPRVAAWPAELRQRLSADNVIDFAAWSYPGPFAKSMRQLLAGIRRWYASAAT